MSPRLLLLAFSAVAINAAGAGLTERVIDVDTLFNTPAQLTLANPALVPLQHKVSLSHALAGFDRSSTEREVSFGEGRGAGAGFFDAATYMKLGAGTIRGHAAYSNGKRFGVSFCDVSNPAVVYPYFTADELGGDYSAESYIFEGSYSSDFKEGTWLYGVGLAYRALQEYRKIDPRPKNTVGRLELNLGFGRRLGSYILAVGVDAWKYRQNSDVIFISELGEVPVYHLTGMDSHYARFAGQGKASQYSGWQRSASLSLFPAGDCGFFATARYGLFTLTKTLKDLNNLPINHIYEQGMKAEAGWRTRSVTASVNVDYRRRRGGETIFGDPAGNVYPELFTMATYSHTTLCTSASACYRHTLPGRRRIDAFASAGFFHSVEEYAGVSPHLRESRNLALCSVKGEYVQSLSKRWMLSAHLAASRVASSLLTAGGGVGVDYILGGDKSIGVQAQGAMLHAEEHNDGWRLHTAIVFKF